MIRRRSFLLCAGLAALAACGPAGAPVQNNSQAEEIETIDVPQTITREPPGTTPMAERVAVLRLLNKRNGQIRDFTLRPGQAVRAGDVIVRLRACETTAPWEVQQLTGAFVQLDVRNPQGHFQRVFSGWLYKESPSLNVVEHPIYDVSPVSCAMTHPEGGGPPPPLQRVGSSSSSASNAAAPAESPAAPAAEAAPSPTADSNSAR
jgi:hypothetical protein